MLATIPATSLLLDPERHPLCPAEAAAALGHTIVFAPHPDDESLGCGGLLALLAGAGIAVTVFIVTDGSRSHPNSVSHSSGRLASIREAETLDAVAELGLAPSSVQFLRYPDCGLPYRGTSIYREAIARLRRLMTDMRPETVLVPWRRDPHCDHIGTWHLLRSTVAGMRSRPRWLEYPVWAWPHAHAGDAPRHDEACAWRIDISSVLARKQRAIAQHRSQLGRLILDDPEGFVLEPAMLAYFTQPWELFIEPHDG